VEPIRRLLRDLGALYDRLHEAVAIGSQARQGALQQLAVVLFLRPRDSTALAPLMHLGNALDALNDNVVMPMLARDPRKGAPPLTQTEWQRRGVVVAAIDLIRQSGERVSVPQAASEVVTIAKNKRPLPSVTAVLQWRKDVLKAPRDRPDAQAYRQTLEVAKTRTTAGEWGPTQLREYAMELLSDPWP
jgi:hypothetical protein